MIDDLLRDPLVHGVLLCLVVVLLGVLCLILNNIDKGIVKLVNSSPTVHQVSELLEIVKRNRSID